MSIYTQPNRRGFWLVESAIAIAIIGISVVAVVGSQQSCHIQAVQSERLATGMRLAAEIREMSLLLPANDPITGSSYWGAELGELIPLDIDDLDDLDDAVFAESDGTGPIDATGKKIVEMPGWGQQIIVECVDPFDITNSVPDGASDVIRLTTKTLYEGEEITRLVWIAPR